MRIDTEDDIDRACAALTALEPRFALAPRPPLRRREDGFAALLRIVVSQQLSVAAAETIWGRLAQGGFDRPEALLSAPDETLRLAGLSRPKVHYARAIAAADVDFMALRRLDDAEAVAALTAIPGVGRWTAEIYLMFCLGRPDVFAPGDLALQEGARLLFDMPARPDPRALDALAAGWAPWRAVAARLLWSYYGAAKQREGVAT